MTQENDIPRRQNEEHPQWLLRARQQTYADAKILQIGQLLIVVAAPVALSVLAICIADLRPHFAVASLALLLIDILFLDRAQRRLLQTAAKISEQFDEEVLSLDWNDFVAGKRVDPEDIHSAARRYPSASAALAKIKDWYPTSVGRAPLYVARIACQLSNLRYDATLRNRYAAFVILLPFVIGLLTIAVWATLYLEFSAVVLSLLVPATPVITWSLREYFRHKDTARGQETIKTAAEALWATIRDCDEEHCKQRSREFQDAIFQRRLSSPLIFPGVYQVLRSEMEDQMNRGANERLTQIGY